MVDPCGQAGCRKYIRQTRLNTGTPVVSQVNKNVDLICIWWTLGVRQDQIEQCLVRDMAQKAIEQQNKLSCCRCESRIRSGLRFAGGKYRQTPVGGDSVFATVTLGGKTFEMGDLGSKVRPRLFSVTFQFRASHSMSAVPLAPLPSISSDTWFCFFSGSLNIIFAPVKG